MDNDQLHVTSEIYAETDFNCYKLTEDTSVSKFSFFYPATKSKSTNVMVAKDSDGDVIVERRKRADIEIVHHKSTDLTLVGLQVWRGALLLADYILHNHELFRDQHVLELGSGFGLTGIAAAIYAKRVICTDIDVGGILDLIKGNIKRNAPFIKGSMDVLELDFTKLNWSEALSKEIADSNIILAADVIYDDDLTDALVQTIEKLLAVSAGKTIYIALEKRYVFTVVDLESLPPCYEYFLNQLDKLRYLKNWRLESIPIDFPQYFTYERVKELVLLKLVA